MQQKGREFVFDRMTFHAKEKTVYKTTDENKFSHGNVAIRSDIVKGKILDIRENKIVNWINEFNKISANI